MGGVLCKPTKQQQQKRIPTKLRLKPQDYPYVDAIRKNQLDYDNNIINNATFTTTTKENPTPKQTTTTKRITLPVQISPNLYLSDANGATNIKRLKELNITHVYNIAGKVGLRIPEEIYQNAGITLRVVEAMDEDDYPILSRHLEDCANFIHEAKRNNNGACLVHCNAGINRSCVIVAAYKMMEERKSVLSVVKECREKRGEVFLGRNQGFQEQLVALARREGLLGPVPVLRLEV